MNQMQGGGSRVMNFGKSKAKRMSVDAPKITFRDVAGVDEAVQELEEIKEFLENPKKFQALGARIPKGVLLYGPPGTGKTLLARAVAGEAGVPFFSISGSDFVEMFVGVGASRVRDLFEQAKQNSPCIIFMDEIDAVGRHRGAGMGGGHDEREQTLNQLLVEMDGFEMKDNIILIAATNRPDILDPALLRPGRFDRQVVVDRPDRKGRKHILEVHTRGKPLAREIDLDTLAGQTPGFTGADLANLINEAALLTARTGNREITMKELEEGIMRVIAGPEKKTRVMSEKERLITAYHEMGHAIVGHLLPNCDPVHKISIISRGQALGYTISLPTEDKFLTTRAELTDTMAMTLGGRAAEEIVFGEITTGASNDLEKVTETAKQMVMRFGMSERLGPRVFGHDRGQPFLGREFSSEPDYSDEIAREIDDEIRRIVESAHQTAKSLLERAAATSSTGSRSCCWSGRRSTPTQFVALLEGKSADEVFADDEEPAQPAEPAPEPERAAARGRTAESAPTSRLRRRRRVLTGAWRRPRSLGAEHTSSLRPCHAWSGCVADETDGGRERDARLVLGRGAVPRSGGGDRARGGAGSRPGRRSSTSAGSRPGRGRRRSRVEEELRRVEPVVAGLAGRGARRSRSTPRRRRSPRRRSTPGRRSSTTSPRCAATRRWRRSAPSAAHGGPDAHARRARGRCRTNPVYGDVVDEVRAFLAERVEAAVAAGIAEERIWLDPGIGFGKTAEHNLELLRRLAELRELGRPLVVGTSRKSFIGRVDGSDAERAARRHDRLLGPRRRRGRRRAARPRRRRGRPGAGRGDGDPRVGCLAMEAARQRDRVERRGRAARPLDLHPPRRQRRRAGGRAAARVRHLLRRPRLRRGPHRPARGHGRLRPGLRHRRPRRDRAQLPDPGAARPGVGERLMERYGCESVRVRAAKPEPPLPLAIQEVAVEVTQERAVDEDDAEPAEG